jgi:hypothetical protein
MIEEISDFMELELDSDLAGDSAWRRYVAFEESFWVQTQTESTHHALLVVGVDLVLAKIDLAVLKVRVRQRELMYPSHFRYVERENITSALWLKIHPGEVPNGMLMEFGEPFFEHLLACEQPPNLYGTSSVL